MKTFLTLASLVAVLLSSSARAEELETSYRFTGRNYSISYELRDGTQTIELYGIVLSQLVEDLRGFNRVKRLLREGVDVRLVLNSGGGFQAVVDTLFESIKDACYERAYERVPSPGPGARGATTRRFVGWRGKKCHVTSIVTTQCASACIPLFMVGDTRIVGRWGLFGFHQAAVAPGFMRIPFMAEGDLRKRGVDAGWLRQNSRMFDSLDITWLGPTQMEGSNIVTEIAP